MKTIRPMLLITSLLLLSLTGTPTSSFTSDFPASAATNPADDPVFIGAGDIGSCPYSKKSKKYIFKGTNAEATAKLVASFLPADTDKGAVFVAGDNAYGQGTAKQYRECYDPTWGRFKERTRPVPGNHEFINRENLPATWYGNDYFDYFGKSAGKKYEGYYSYDLGEWHIVALNSELRDTPQLKPMTKQKNWLREDLTNNRRRCTLAYWHRPVFSSGEHGAGHTTPGIERTMQSVWRILDEMGVDVVINGHDHNYERFHPQDADGRADPNGIVEFVIGTGGTGLRDEEIPPAQRRNSAVFDKFTWGVLKLTLHPDSYDFEFIPAASRKAGSLFRDKSTSPVLCVE